MEAKKLFSKLNIKDYNNELEEVLEGKVFSYDVKNLLLSMLYKIESVYKDYEKIKVEVMPSKEFISNIIKTIQEKCFDIEYLPRGTKEKIIIDKEKGKICCYPNELSLLSAIWYMGEEETTIVSKYYYTKEAMQNMLIIGNNMNSTEILRDFSGWSWDVLEKEIENKAYNILYQSLLMLDGNRLLKLNIESDEKNSILIQKDKKELKNFFETLVNCTMNLYMEENEENYNEINTIKKEKEKGFKLINDKKAYVQKITNDKRKCLAQIEKIDKISNNSDLLKKEYQERNKLLPNKEKIFSISHLSDRLEKERESLLSQINKCNKSIEPKEYVKEKERLEEEVNFLQTKYSVIDCCKECLKGCKQQIEKIDDRADIIKWIYKIRYYLQLPYDKETKLKDIKKIEEEIKQVIQLLTKKAQEHKIWDIFTENRELEYVVIKEVFFSKIICLENISIDCDYVENILIINYYDKDVLETSIKLDKEHVRIKKKFKLFI